MKRLAWVLALILCACAARLENPTVSLAGLDVESVGLFEQNFLLRLRVRNPNDRDIPVEGLAFDLELAGKPFARGVSNQAVTIPRLGEAVLEVKATSNLLSFLRQWADPARTEDSLLDYRVKGDLRVSGYGTVPFDHRGRAAVPRVVPRRDERPRPLPGAI